MTEYRLYSPGGNGERTNVYALGATDDADAIDQVEVMQVRVACELWERARLVASFQFKPSAPPNPLKAFRPSRAHDGPKWLKSLFRADAESLDMRKQRLIEKNS